MPQSTTKSPWSMPKHLYLNLAVFIIRGMKLVPTKPTCLQGGYWSLELDPRFCVPLPQSIFATLERFPRVMSSGARFEVARSILKDTNSIHLDVKSHLFVQGISTTCCQNVNTAQVNQKNATITSNKVLRGVLKSIMVMFKHWLLFRSLQYAYNGLALHCSPDAFVSGDRFFSFSSQMIYFDCFSMINA